MSTVVEGSWIHDDVAGPGAIAILITMTISGAALAIHALIQCMLFSRMFVVLLRINHD
jgi:ABC-type uncharacterized transport system permease subunit